MPSTSQYKPVVLWGIEEGFDIYVESLNDSGIQIAAFIDSNNKEYLLNKPNKKNFPNTKIFSNIYDFFARPLSGGHAVQEHYEILNESEFARRREEFEDCPVIVTATDPFDETSFLFHAERIVSLIGTQGRILHPVVLADVSRLTYPGRIFHTGFPGSGNLLNVTILNHLMKRRGVLDHGRKEARYMHLAQNYFLMVKRLLKDIFPDCTAMDEMAVHGEKTALRLYFNDKENDLVHIVYNNRNYLGTDFYSVHEIPRKDTCALFKDKGYDIIFSIRNPLDVILSYANKISFKNPHLLINNLDWFEDTAEIIKHYFESYIENKKYSHFMFYEKTCGKPEPTIRELAKIVGVSLCDEDIAEIWRLFGFKELAPQHLWRPGVSKWREYFSKENIDILKKHKYDELLSLFGYTDRINYDENIYRCEKSSNNDDLNLPFPWFALNDYFAHEHFGKKISIVYPKYVYNENIYNSWYAFTTNQEYLNEWLRPNHRSRLDIISSAADGLKTD